MRAVLVLADGTEFVGEAFGASADTVGEVVFNTSMTGYQEIVTDPSYSGQIVVLTYPLIGNYGVNPEDSESDRPQIRGLVVKELCDQYSSWRGTMSLNEFLLQHNVVGIQGIDTRQLTRRLREHGTMWGSIGVGDVDTASLMEIARKHSEQMQCHDFVLDVTGKEPYFLDGCGPHIAVVDYGAKRNIVRSLQALGCRVTVVPATMSAADILSFKPDGVVLSNGPGDPKSVPYGQETARQLVGRVPVMGICLGHQLLALGLGADTFKLKYGHRGGNHPVQDTATGRVYITSQNHGYAVAEESLAELPVRVSHLNLNDHTIEGIEHVSEPAFSVQYHPEAKPGPTDSEYIFERFLDMVQGKISA